MRWGLLFRAQQYLKNSLWVIPFLGGVVGVILAQVGLWLDTLGFLSAWEYSPETATAVVSATISAVASLTGFVVTVTVLGVQMATGTFSPRYMRMWYRDGRLKGGLLGQMPQQQLGEPLPGTAPPPGTVISPGLVQNLPPAPDDGSAPAPPGLILPPPPPPAG